MFLMKKLAHMMKECIIGFVFSLELGQLSFFLYLFQFFQDLQSILHLQLINLARLRPLKTILRILFLPLKLFLVFDL